MIPTIAKFLLLGIFFISGLLKLSSIGGTANMIASVGLPFATTLAYVVAVYEVIAPVLIISKPESKVHDYLVWSLALFTIMVTFLYHNVFTDSKNKYKFMKNMSITGGLLLLLDM